MTGGAVGGVAFVVIIEVQEDGAVGIKLIPERRGVLEAGVDELQARGVVTDRMGRRTEGDEKQERNKGVAHGKPKHGIDSIAAE